VAALLGGLSAWEQAGYPTETSAEPTQETVEESVTETAGRFEQEVTAVLGDPDAPVTIVDFSDYQCPYCRRHFEQTLPRIIETYVETGQARYVYKDFPLHSIHPNAQKAAEAAECAGEQGQYWPMHDRIFQGQDQWARSADPVPALKEYAAALGLDASQFATCLDSGQFAAEVEADLSEGMAAGVTGTPGFFINGRPLFGAMPFSEFQRVIEKELTR
jgi:protein-disulfide isomerase